MNVRRHSLLFATLAALLCACSGNKDQASGAGTASPSGAASSGAAAAPGKASGKTVHVKQTQGECTFDFDAPETFKQTGKDDMSFTLESDSFSFVGFEGQTLHNKPEHALDSSKDFKEVYRGTEPSGVQVAVLAPAPGNNNLKPTDKHYVGGMGGEPYASGRSLGCTFLCDGVAARQDDVVAMCRSVRITVKPEAKK